MARAEEKRDSRFFVNGMAVSPEAFIRYVKQLANSPKASGELLYLESKRPFPNSSPGEYHVTLNSKGGKK